MIGAAEESLRLTSARCVQSLDRVIFASTPHRVAPALRSHQNTSEEEFDVKSGHLSTRVALLVAATAALAAGLATMAGGSTLVVPEDLA
ncbi:MAG TPA: hypothetical protein VGC78_12270, partial [Gaiellaceae bacterium]